MRSVLEISDLRVSFRTEGGAVHAVNGISYSVYEGEVLGVVGESGSGKSVHALSIMRLVSPQSGTIDSGEIKFKGVELSSLSEAAMRRVRGKQIAMIFQDPVSSLNPVLTIGFQLCETLRLHLGMSQTAARQRAFELLTLVGIADAAQRLDAYPHQMSGGMRQRVMIAMAIACDPKLVIADEPTTALDVTIQAQIIELIKRLQKSLGLTVIWISHDLGVVAGLAQTVNVMYAGYIVERGPVRDIYKNASHPYTVGLLGSMPRLDDDFGGKLQSIPGKPPDISKVSLGCPFLPRCAHATDQCVIEMPPIESSALEAIQFDAGIGGISFGQGNAMVEPEILVEVRDLCKFFPINRGLVFERKVGEVKAVDRVSFQIFRGETLGLVGESGSGKTTVGRTLLRLVEPTAGEIIIEGTDFRKLSRSKLRVMRQRMQMIFQDPFASLNPRMRIEELIAEPLYIQGQLGQTAIKHRVSQLLDLVGLGGDFQNRYAHEFSGGQRQRIGIARALALNPSLIVCDEPIASLDVSIQAQIVNLLEELQDRLGLSYLFIAHDLGMVRHISDRVAVMYLGRIMELADKNDIYRQPLHPYTRALISAVPVPDPDIEAARGKVVLEGEIPSPANPPPGCVFSTRCKYAAAICSTVVPRFREVKPRHFAACHLIESIEEVNPPSLQAIRS